MNLRQGTPIIMKMSLQVCSPLPAASAICPPLDMEKKVAVKHSMAQGGEDACQKTDTLYGGKGCRLSEG